MGAAMQGLIHYNIALAHQVDHAQAFLSCGFDAVPSPLGDADVHVISGPHYAKRYWLNHPRVLEIDRAWWGDPDCISIGWRQPDGTRKFASGDAPRNKPEMQPWTQGEDSCLILADYGQDTADIEQQARQRFSAVQTRPHPADKRSETTLEAAIRAHDVVIGTTGTAIFKAIQMGVPTICLDEKNECWPACSSMDTPLYRGDRTQWLHEMSYKQFNLAEIGVAWELLRDIL